MKKILKRLYYSIFKRYQRLDFGCFLYDEADELIKQNGNKPESEQWVIAKEEDTNFNYGVVCLERRVRIRE